MNEANDGLYISSFLYDFSDSQEGWQGDFVDYPVSVNDSTDDDSTVYALRFSHTERPKNLGGSKALMLSGNNQGADLFMFIKKKITGLAPDVSYNLVFEVELASELPEKGLGKEVLLKAGATYSEPKKMIDNGLYVLNIDKGTNLDRGEDMIVLGTIGVVEPAKEFKLITRTNGESYGPFIAKSNSKGEMWLLIGTESLFKGTTTVYYSKINVVLSTSY
jgi:hypothetical protein